MTQYWGVDSVTPANNKPGSQTLAAQVVAAFGAPHFWGRYFHDYADNCPQGQACYTNTEGNVLSNNGIHRVLPIQSPPQDRLGASDAHTKGQYDGNHICNHIV